MRRDARLAAVLLLLLCAVPLYAELKLVSTEFSPASFTAGMKVQVFARLELLSGSLPEGVLKPEQGALRKLAPSVEKILLKKQTGYYLYTLTFIAWQVGPGTLPSMQAGTEILPAIPFTTVSSLSEDASLPPPRAQKELPGMRIRIYLFVGLLLAIALSGVLAAFVLPRILAGFFIRRSIFKARRTFLQTLSELEKSGDSGPDSWKRLCGALRFYIGFRLTGNADFSPALTGLPALTAREFSCLAPDLIPGGGHDALAGIFLRADVVRWAGFADSRLPQAVKDAREAVDSLENALPGSRASSPEKKRRGESS